MGKRGKAAKKAAKHNRWARLPEGGEMYGNRNDDNKGKGAPQAPQAPPDPTIIQAVTDYRIFRGAGDLAGLTKPLTWFMTGKGLVPVRRGNLGLFIGKAVGSPVPGLPELESGVKLEIPRLSWVDLCDVLAFFRAVHAKHKSEAMVQFFWNPEGGADKKGGYISVAPIQDVSGGGVRHTGDFDKDGQLIHVLDIHSHHTMGAYWSGTDDNDEKRFEGRLYGVIGGIDKKLPEMKWRSFVGGAFVDLVLEDVVDVEQAPLVKIEREFKVADLLRVAQASNNNNKDNHRFVFEYDPFESHDSFPEVWMKSVVDRPFQVGGGAGGRVVVSDKGMTEDEKKALRAQGFIEQGMGRWVLPFPRLIPGMTSSSPTGPTGAGGKTDLHHCRHGRSYRESCDACTKQANGKRIGRWIYDRVQGNLYMEGEDGRLYLSTLTPDVAAREFPHWVFTFVDGVDDELVGASKGASWQH